MAETENLGLKHEHRRRKSVLTRQIIEGRWAKTG
jgi:hypothetical protein